MKKALSVLAIISVMALGVVAIYQYRHNSNWNEAQPSNTDYALPEGALYINEVCSKNRYTILDSYDEESDWIELYNNSTKPINLKGYSIAENRFGENRFVFEDCIIEPKDYLLLFASGRGLTNDKKEIHCNFKLSQEGGALYLFNNLKKCIDKIAFPGLKDDVSFGIINNQYSKLTPSPREENKNVYIEREILNVPLFSQKSGFYDEPFLLELKSSGNYEIRYTLNSEEPDEDSPIYSSPINIYDKSPSDNVLSNRSDICAGDYVKLPSTPVAKCVVVRARCYDSLGNYSPISSSCFWVGENNKYNDGTTVVSVSTSFDNLFGYEKGIYCDGKIYNEWRQSEEYNPTIGRSSRPANYQQKGFEWERPASINIVKDGNDYNQTVGIRIHGSGSRCLQKKSFNIYSRYLYDGHSYFNSRINGLKTDSFSLRAGGNVRKKPVNDNIAQEIAKQINVSFESQNSTPCYLFLNGEFWGVYYITDKYNESFFANRYSINDVIIIKSRVVENGFQSDIYLRDLYNKTILQTDFTIDTNYQTFLDFVDVDSFIDYCVFGSFVNCSDWTAWDYYNTGMWASRTKNNLVTKQDGKIRHLLFDCDLGLGVSRNSDHNPFIESEIGIFLRGLKKNDAFRNRFLERASFLISQIASEKTAERYNNLCSSLLNPLNKDNERWFVFNDIDEIQDYFNDVSAYLKERCNSYLLFMNEYFNN